MSTKAIEALLLEAKNRLFAAAKGEGHRMPGLYGGEYQSADDIADFVRRIDATLTSLRSSPPAPSELVEAGDVMKQWLGKMAQIDDKDVFAAIDAWNRAKSSQPSPWISVETRLPEPYTWVLVFSDTSETGDFQFDIGRVIGGEWKCLGWDYPVTHWMPLPDNPLS